VATTLDRASSTRWAAASSGSLAPRKPDMVADPEEIEVLERHQSASADKPSAGTLKFLRNGTLPPTDGVHFIGGLYHDRVKIRIRQARLMYLRLRLGYSEESSVSLRLFSRDVETPRESVSFRSVPQRRQRTSRRPRRATSGGCPSAGRPQAGTTRAGHGDVHHGRPDDPELNRRRDERPRLLEQARPDRTRARERLERLIDATENGEPAASLRDRIRERQQEVACLDATLAELSGPFEQRLAIMPTWVRQQLEDLATLLRDAPQRAKMEFHRLALRVRMDPRVHPPV
jgi:hypothetical protein